MIRTVCSATTPSADRVCTSTSFPMPRKNHRAAQYMGNTEPCLEELLSDDVLIRLMARDGVGADQLRKLAGFVPN